MSDEAYAKLCAEADELTTRAVVSVAGAYIVHERYDAGLELTREVDQQVREFFGEIVFDTVIPRDVNISEAPSHGQSIMTYSPRSRGCRAYIELCMEVLERD